MKKRKPRKAWNSGKKTGPNSKISESLRAHQARLRAAREQQRMKDLIEQSSDAFWQWFLDATGQEAVLTSRGWVVDKRKD